MEGGGRAISCAVYGIVHAGAELRLGARCGAEEEVEGEEKGFGCC